jgi:histidinol-phosphate/aromatic aminotransferase/cobyric acid decarboxylase-like protein
MSLHLFKSEERQHSPSVFQVAAAAGHSQVVDFCYLSNKFFPTPEIIAKLGERLEEVVRNYPSMQVEQTDLAARLTGFDPQHIIVGNGASELIHLIAARLGSRWLMPYPSYTSSMWPAPPPDSRIATLRAPASSAFSTRSLSALAGLSTTSPAAIRSTSSGGSLLIDMG